jgi:hypothetical protein
MILFPRRKNPVYKTLGQLIFPLSIHERLITDVTADRLIFVGVEYPNREQLIDQDQRSPKFAALQL